MNAEEFLPNSGGANRVHGLISRRVGTLPHGVAVGVLAVTLAACGHAPPPYESHYSSSPTSSAAPVEQASFVDGFNGDDTELGLGEGWDTRGGHAGSFPLPAATDGFIADGNYTYAGDSVVYAARQLRGTVRRIGAAGSWTQAREGGETTMAMAITANDLLITDMLQFIVNRSLWELTARRADGALEPVMTGRFPTPLELNRDYQFEIEATDASVTVRVPGSEVTTNLATSGLLGDRAFWAELPDLVNRPTGVVFNFDNVWAVEDGQALIPIGN